MSNEQNQPCLDFQPQLAAYALGEAELDAALHTHLLGCATCQHTLREYAQVARVLPYAAPDIAPPPELRERILAQARGEASGPTAQMRLTAMANRRSWWRRLAWPSFVVAGALVLALLGWNVAIQARLSQQTAATNASSAQLQAVESILSAPDAQSYPLTGTNASGRVWVSAERNQAYFVAQALPDPGADKVYQMWLIQGDAPVSAGTFETHDGNAATVVSVHGPLTDFAAFGVTVEPRGGSTTPTSQPILIGSLESSMPHQVKTPLVSTLIIVEPRAFS